eukprot:4610878-Alexandrium_andersonii.AAC.1
MLGAPRAPAPAVGLPRTECAPGRAPAGALTYQLRYREEQLWPWQVQKRCASTQASEGARLTRA